MISTLETLRYYENEGLISAPKRLLNGYRFYDENHIQQLGFINMAKQLGFTLKDIKLLLSLRIPGKTPTGKTFSNVAEAQSKLFAEKIKQLTNMKKTLDELITLCERSKETSAKCPILASLDKDLYGHE